jgi:hypothetical protein
LSTSLPSNISVSFFKKKTKVRKKTSIADVFQKKFLHFFNKCNYQRMKAAIIAELRPDNKTRSLSEKGVQKYSFLNCKQEKKQ